MVSVIREVKNHTVQTQITVQCIQILNKKTVCLQGEMELVMHVNVKEISIAIQMLMEQMQQRLNLILVETHIIIHVEQVFLAMGTLTVMKMLMVEMQHNLKRILEEATLLIPVWIVQEITFVGILNSSVFKN